MHTYIGKRTSSYKQRGRTDDFVTRVTRLGEFSPVERLFTLGSIFLKITKVDKIFGAMYFVPCLRLSINFDQYWLGFVRFFENSSGRPAQPTSLRCN
jgi:hypothetical protein